MMTPGMAALRLGFCARQLWADLDSIWAVIPTQIVDVQPRLDVLDKCLHSISGFPSDFQRASFAEICDRIAARHSGAAAFLGEMLNDESKNGYKGKKAINRLKEKIASDDTAISGWKNWQREDWDHLRSMLVTAIRNDIRLAAWFEVGDHLAEVLEQVRSGKLKAPLSDAILQHLFSGISRLTPYEQKCVRHRIKADATDNMLLFEQLGDAYSSLSAILLTQESKLIARPKWDGAVLAFRGQQIELKPQSNGVITEILGGFEKSAWLEQIRLSDEIDGDVTQAIYNFNKKCSFLRLSRRMEMVRWSEADDTKAGS